MRNRSFFQTLRCLGELGDGASRTHSTALKLLQRTAALFCREIIVCEKEYEIAGVTILKSTKEEAKICTMYVAEQYRHNGLGRRLMELSLEWLKNDKPVITLDKSKEPDFAGILKHFGFVLQEENCGLYNPGKIELIYNGKN